MRLIDEIKKAKEKGYAIGQFNFCTFEQLKGITKAAKERQVPVILGTSENEANFFGISEAVAVRDLLRKDYPAIFLNLDHGKNLDKIEKAISTGYDMIHFDGSDLEFEKNIEITKKISKITKQKGIVLEGEVGKIGGSSKINLGHYQQPEENLTSVDSVVKFIEETDADLCAVSFGNVHGIFQQMPELDLDRIAEMQKLVGSIIVMHGGSGISDEEVKEAIKRGVVKININTELRQIWKNGLEENLANPEEIVPYKILSGISDKIAKKTLEKINIFYENNI